MKNFHLIFMSTTPRRYTLFFNGFSSRFPNLHTLRLKRCRDGYPGRRYDSFGLAESFDALEGHLPFLRFLVLLEFMDDWFVFSKWFKSLREKGAVIDHVTISYMPFASVHHAYELIQSLERDDVSVILYPATMVSPGPIEGSEVWD